MGTRNSGALPKSVSTPAEASRLYWSTVAFKASASSPMAFAASSMVSAFASASSLALSTVSSSSGASFSHVSRMARSNTVYICFCVMAGTLCSSKLF